MKNVLVGVTRQRASDRLISYGKELAAKIGRASCRERV